VAATVPEMCREVEVQNTGHGQHSASSAAVFQIVQVCACTPETATLALDATVDIESAVDLILTGFFNDLQVE
jgi:hypothetical protein